MTAGGFQAPSRASGFGQYGRRFMLKRHSEWRVKKPELLRFEPLPFLQENIVVLEVERDDVSGKIADCQSIGICLRKIKIRVFERVQPQDCELPLTPNFDAVDGHTTDGSSGYHGAGRFASNN